jgi:hypothetical protein
MTFTPFADLAQRARSAAMKGTRLHLELEHARALALNPRVQALLGELIAEETARLCPSVEPGETQDSPGLPLFQEPAYPPPNPARPAMPSAPPPPAAIATSPSTSNGAPIAANMPSPGMTPALVQDAASSQVSELAMQLSRQSRHEKRSRRTSSPSPGRARPKPRLTLVSQPS